LELVLDWHPQLPRPSMSHILEYQTEVLTFLADPATHGGLPVHRIETHAAVVFLAGERALKVKRAVRFPFLDYSTLDKRKAACFAEVEVNRSFAPELYRGVVAITREPDGSLALAGSGVPVEWAIDMHRFDETATLDHLADAGRLDAALADALGRLVAAVQARERNTDASRWIDALEVYVTNNDDAFRERPELFDATDTATLAALSRARLQALHPLLAERGRSGLIRRGHGDLHLANIALINGKPVLFDAIEFDPLIASGDVLYELSFLLMDLVHRRLQAQANIVFNRYLVETGRLDDLDGLAALPLFLSLRAAIRAHVTAARLESAQAGERAAIARMAESYFKAALQFISPPPPMLLAVGGLSGTGKSLLARALAPDIGPAPGALLLRSDVERKRAFGKTEIEKLPPAAYEPAVTTQVYATLIDKARRALRAGHSVVVDAVFARPDERGALAAVVAKEGIRFQGLYLETDLATRLARVGARTHDASDADTAVALRQESYDLGVLDWTRIDAGGTPDDTLVAAEKVLLLQK
jgi:aminoglycoside phosphotransferase family enzyme/predicted kinase